MMLPAKLFSWRKGPRLALGGATLAASLCLAAGSGVLSVEAPAPVTAKRGETAVVRLRAVLQRGYHVNSSTPSDEYLIPLQLSWKAEPLEVEEVVFPKPKTGQFSFSDKPLSVYTGAFEITTRFRVPATAPAGEKLVSGKLRYQACSDKLCLPPKTIPVQVTFDVQ